MWRSESQIVLLTMNINIELYIIITRLVSKRQMDASISHYIEAGTTVKALEAAVGAKQWRKALQVYVMHYTLCHEVGTCPNKNYFFLVDCKSY